MIYTSNINENIKKKIQLLEIENKKDNIKKGYYLNENHFLQGGKGSEKIYNILKDIVEKYNNQVTDIELVGNGFLRCGNFKKLGIYTDDKTKEVIKLEDGEIEDVLKVIVPSNYKDGEGRVKLPVSFSFTTSQLGSFRATAYKSNWGMIVSLRRLISDIPDFTTLGFSNNILEVILKGVGYTFSTSSNTFESSGYAGGMLVITGPMGSGKTTTLASALKLISDMTPLKSISIEDPIEYVHCNSVGQIVQLEIGEHVKSREEALYVSLRSNSSVLVIGEVRDKVELDILLRASINGCFVMTTYHVPDTVAAIERMCFEMESDTMKQLLASSLIGVLNQRIVKSIITDRPLLLYEWLPVKGIKPIINNIIEGKFANIRQGIKKNIWETEGAASFANVIKEKASLGLITGEEYKYFMDILGDNKNVIYG